jgi:hypothetical protein
MSYDINTCFEMLDKAKQAEFLDRPCREVVIVYSAWGIIGNGGLQSFFENNFDGDPPFDVFAQAFRNVGFEEIALRFSELVALFPFNNPHQFSQKRQEFLDAQPPDFSAAMTKLEDLIFKHDNIEETLNTFLQREHEGKT